MFNSFLGTPDIEKLKAENNVRGLLRVFLSEDEPARQEAFEALLGIQPAPKHEFIKLLRHKSPEIQWMAARALAQIGGTEAVEPLIGCLQNGQGREYQKHIARSLLQLGWTPPAEDRALQVLFLITQERWAECVPFGAGAVDWLIYELEQHLPDGNAADTAPEAVDAISDALCAIGTPAAQKVIALLRREDDPLRRQAENVVLCMKDAAIPALTQTLSVDNESLQLYILHLIEEINDPRPAANILHLMLHGGPHLQSSCANVLGKVGNQSTIDLLANTQQRLIEATIWNKDDPNYDREKVTQTRRKLNYVERALAKIGPESVPSLIAHFGEENARLVEHSIRTLQRMGQAASPALVEALDSNDQRYRANSAKALDLIAWKAENPRDRAAHAVAKQQWESAVECGAEAIPVLLAALHFSELSMREQAANALEKIGWVPERDEDSIYYFAAKNEFARSVEIGRPAVKPLIKLMQEMVLFAKDHPKDPQPGKMLRGIEKALGDIGQAAVVDLVLLLESKKGFMRPYAADILARIGKPSVELLTKSARGNQSADVRYEAARALLRIEEADANDVFIEKLRDSSPRLRRLATSYFQHHHHHHAMNLMIEMLENEEEEMIVRQSAALALGYAKVPEAVPALKSALDSEHRGLQIAAVNALSELGEYANQPDVIRVLIELLTDSEGKLQTDTSRTLSVIGDIQCAAWLLDLLLDVDQRIESDYLAMTDKYQMNRLHQTRVYIRQALVDMGQRTIEVIFQRYLDQALVIREEVLGVLRKLGESGDLYLRSKLTSADRRTREAAADLLEQLGWVPNEGEMGAAYAIIQGNWKRLPEFGDDAIMPLLDALEEDDWVIRRRATEALDAIGWIPQANANGCHYWIVKEDYEKLVIVGQAAVMPLIQALDDVLRMMAKHQGDMKMLGEKRNHLKVTLYQIGMDAIPELMACFRDPDTFDETRTHLSHILTFFRRSAEVPLIEALNDLDSILSVRQQSAWALGEVQSSRALPDLIAILEREPARQTLIFDVVDALGKIARAHQRRDVHVRISAALVAYLKTGQTLNRKLLNLIHQVLNECSVVDEDDGLENPEA